MARTGDEKEDVEEARQTGRFVLVPKETLIELVDVLFAIESVFGEVRSRELDSRMLRLRLQRLLQIQENERPRGSPPVPSITQAPASSTRMESITEQQTPNSRRPLPYKPTEPSLTAPEAPKPYRTQSAARRLPHDTVYKDKGRKDKS